MAASSTSHPEEAGDGKKDMDKLQTVLDSKLCDIAIDWCREESNEVTVEIHRLQRVAADNSTLDRADSVRKLRDILKQFRDTTRMLAKLKEADRSERPPIFGHLAVMTAHWCMADRPEIPRPLPSESDKVIAQLATEIVGLQHSQQEMVWESDKQAATIKDRDETIKEKDQTIKERDETIATLMKQRHDYQVFQCKAAQKRKEPDD